MEHELKEMSAKHATCDTKDLAVVGWRVITVILSALRCCKYECD